MHTLNLSAIATSSALAGVALISLQPPAHAGEINLICNARQGSTTTIALNTEDAIFQQNWSIADAIYAAYAVSKQCQAQGNQANATPVPKYTIKLSAAPNTSMLNIQKEAVPVVTSTPVKTPFNPSKPDALW